MKNRITIYLSQSFKGRAKHEHRLDSWGERQLHKHSTTSHMKPEGPLLKETSEKIPSLCEQPPKHKPTALTRRSKVFRQCSQSHCQSRRSDICKSCAMCHFQMPRSSQIFTYLCMTPTATRYQLPLRERDRAELGVTEVSGTGRSPGWARKHLITAHCLPAARDRHQLCAAAMRTRVRALAWMQTSQGAG